MVKIRNLLTDLELEVSGNYFNRPRKYLILIIKQYGASQEDFLDV